MKLCARNRSEVRGRRLTATSLLALALLAVLAPPALAEGPIPSYYDLPKAGVYQIMDPAATSYLAYNGKGRKVIFQNERNGGKSFSWKLVPGTGFQISQYRIQARGINDKGGPLCVQRDKTKKQNVLMPCSTDTAAQQWFVESLTFKDTGKPAAYSITSMDGSIVVNPYYLYDGKHKGTTALQIAQPKR